MLFYHFAYLLVIILSINCRSLTSIPIRTQDSFITNNEEFIPTNEWQIVKEGQAVPPGLHIRLNLQTGLREAKLLEDTRQKSVSNDLVLISEDKEKEKLSKQNLQRAFANLDLSKDDVITTKEHEEEIRKKFRSYDDLKKDFESINMKIQTDNEILINLINRLIKSNNDEDRKTILIDLEFYLHQYDNAILFSDMNGLELFIQLLNSTHISNDIRYLTSLAAGAAFQGNPKVQLKGLNIGYVQYLLRLLNIEQDNTMKIRLIFILSTLLRNFPQAQSKFLEYGGIEIIIKIFHQINSNNKLKIRAIELMNDLIIEKDQAREDKQLAYENIDIRNQLIKHDWCSYISNYLSTIDPKDFDQIGKILLAMIPLTDVCRDNFVSSLPILEKLNEIYTNNHLIEDSNSIDLLIHIQNLRKNLEQKFSNDL